MRQHWCQLICKSNERRCPPTGFHCSSYRFTVNHRADPRLASSQWETLLQCNTVSHWLCVNLESDLESFIEGCLTGRHHGPGTILQRMPKATREFEIILLKLQSVFQELMRCYPVEFGTKSTPFIWQTTILTCKYIYTYIYIYIKWTVFVNVTTKSAQHAHARMIATIIVEKSPNSSHMYDHQKLTKSTDKWRVPYVMEATRVRAQCVHTLCT